jgi:capsular polysaccharide biosynthesis protein
VTTSATPTYESRAAVLVDQPFAITFSGDQGVIQKLAGLRLKYVGLVSTSRVVSPVAERVGMPATELSATLSAFIDPNSLLLYVVARTSDADTAIEIATEIAEQLNTDADRKQDTFNIPTERRFTLNTVNISAAEKVAPTARRVVAVSVLSGALALAVALAIVGVLRVRRLRA